MPLSPMDSSDEVEAFLSEQGLSSPVTVTTTREMGENVKGSNFHEVSENDINGGIDGSDGGDGGGIDGDVTASRQEIIDAVGGLHTDDDDNYGEVEDEVEKEEKEEDGFERYGDEEGNDADISNATSEDNEVTFNREMVSGVGNGDESGQGLTAVEGSELKKSKWDEFPSKMKDILTSFGLPTGGVSDTPNNPGEILRVMGEMGEEIRRRDDAVERMAFDRRANESYSIAQESLGQRNVESLEEERRKLDRERNKAERLEREVERLKKKAATEIRKLKTEAEGLKRSVKQEVHKARAKDAVIEKLTNKLRVVEERHVAGRRHREETFARIRHRNPRRASPSDSQTLEVIGMYEDQREDAMDEIGALRDEVSRLSVKLEKAEGREGGNFFEEAMASAEDTNRIAAVQREEQAKAEELLGKQEARFGRKITKLEESLKSAREHLSSSQDENANLVMELRSRPTVREYREAERRIDELERKLYAAVEAAAESADVRELKKYMGTKALVDQDKSNHRLRLERLDALPREVSKEILKAACRELEISDVALIAPCIQKLNKAMLMLPRMEKFINEVCQLVFEGIDGKGGKRTMEDVIPILKKQKDGMRNAGKTLEFKAIVVGELCRRSVVPGDARKRDSPSGGIVGRTPGLTPSMSDEQALRAVRDLVELEKAILARDDLYKSAETVVQKNPDLFVNRVVLHFRYLFGVKNMEGVFPKMNEVYLFTNECQGFIRELRAIFGMSSKMPTAAVIKSVLDVAATSNEGNSSPSADQEEEDEELENFVVM